MSDWSLPDLLSGLHDDIRQRLATSRRTLKNNSAKGDASERVWLDMLQKYLPKRYQAETAFVVDSKGRFSHQIDIVIFDQQYSPFIFNFENQLIIPAESIYAVFEAKQSVNATNIAYAQEKIESVRVLERTSIPIPHAGGTFAPKPPINIVGGIVSFDSDWSDPLGPYLTEALEKDVGNGLLDLGCIASHGTFCREKASFKTDLTSKAATAFLLELIARLQQSGTVPMIDIHAYAKWLA